MKLSSQVVSALEIAGHVAGETFPSLANDAIALTSYTQDSGNKINVVAHGAPGKCGTNEQRRLALYGSIQPGQFRFLMYCAKSNVPDSRAMNALIFEFGKYPAELSGLTLALPYTPPIGKLPLFAGMVQALAVPKGARHMIDLWLPVFIKPLSDAGGRVWIRALGYDKAVAPSQERYEADTTPLPILCPSLDQASDEPDSNDMVNRYLDALIERYPFYDGIAFRRALSQIELNFTVESLLRIDHLLGRLAAGFKESPEQFLRHRAHRNFLYAVAAYCGKTVAKAAQSRVDWYTGAQYRRRFAPAADAGSDERDSLVGVFNLGEKDGSRAFFPLHAVIGRLFGAIDSARFRGQLKQWGRMAQACRPRQINDEMATVQQMIDQMPAGARKGLKTPHPDWAAGTGYEVWFRSYLSLFEQGRLVWGYLIQANYAIFSEGKNNCAGEVIYDPQGVLTPPQMASVASRISALKCARLFDPRLAFYSDHMTEEQTPAFALRVPYVLSSDDLCLSTLIFIRSHLPQGKLVGSCMPLLARDDMPGFVIVLPHQFWTPAIARQCAEFGWRT